MDFSENMVIKKMLLHKKKLMQGLILALTILASLCLLLIIFQPTNVVMVDEKYNTAYMAWFAWIGILLSAPIAYAMVKPVPELQRTQFGKIVHNTGIWGTRLCIVFLMYLLFSVGGYLLPKHIVSFAAAETFSEKVIFRDYRLSSVPVSPPYQAGRFYINNEYLLLIRNDGAFLPLVINNWFGTNKLKYDQVENYLGNPGTRMQLNGRRHAKGYVFDSLTMK